MESRSMVALGWGVRKSWVAGIIKGHEELLRVTDIFTVLIVLMVLGMYTYVEAYQILLYVFVVYYISVVFQ